MEVVTYPKTQTLTVNDKVFYYDRMEIHTHIVEKKKRLGFSELDPNEVAGNILHNGRLMSNSGIELIRHPNTGEPEPAVCIYDQVGKTLINNRWIMRN